MKKKIINTLRSSVFSVVFFSFCPDRLHFYHLFFFHLHIIQRYLKMYQHFTYHYSNINTRLFSFYDTELNLLITKLSFLLSNVSPLTCDFILIQWKNIILYIVKSYAFNYLKKIFIPRGHHFFSFEKVFIADHLSLQYTISVYSVYFRVEKMFVEK